MCIHELIITDHNKSQLIITDGYLIITMACERNLQPDYSWSYPDANEILLNQFRALTDNPELRSRTRWCWSIKWHDVASKSYPVKVAFVQTQICTSINTIVRNDNRFVGRIDIRWLRNLKSWLTRPRETSTF